MSIKSTPTGAKIRMVIDAGSDENNKPVTKYKTLDKARPEMENEVLFNIAKEVASLQSHTIKNIIKHEEYELSEE